MANKRHISLLISSALAILGFTAIAMPADIASQKEEVNRIKKNSLYIYGEGVAETAGDSERLAELRFTEALTEYIHSVPELDEADVVIIPPVRKEMQKITFDRTAKRKVTFLYILKSEVAPLMKGAPKETAEPSEACCEPSEEQCDSVNVCPADTIAEERITVVESEIAEVDSLKTEPEAATDDCCHLDGLRAKEAEIVRAVIEAVSFENVREYLVGRKATRHDILFKGANSFDSVSDKGFWIIFDKSKNIIAVLDTDAATPIYKKGGNADSDYSKNGKIWLKIN